MRRLFLVVGVVTTLALPASVAAVAFSSSAGAASGVTCKKLSGNVAGTIKIKTCSPKKATYTTLSGAAASLASGGTLTWNNGQSITVAAPSNTGGSGPCPKNWTAEASTTTITAQSAGNTYTQVGDVISSQSCVSSKGNIKLAKSTTLSL